MTPIAPASDLAHSESARQSLGQAFVCFREAAESLERSYRQLEGEVAHLRRKLEERNAELARSLAEKIRMRDGLHTILEGLPCGVLVTQSGGTVSFVNRAAAKLLDANYFPEKLLPVPLGAALEHCREGGEWELEFLANNAPCFHLRHTSLGAGESVYIVEDVTDQKRLAHNRERIERDRALAEMAAVLAHEIRNPLGSLELFAGLLAESASDAEQRSWSEQLQAGLRMLSATVNNVLHFHQISGSHVALTDLGELLAGVKDFLEPMTRQSGVDLRLAHELQGVQLYADRHRLEQVLLNLAINALRALSGRGNLLFSGKLLPSAIAEIEVRDDGPGLPMEYLERVFDAGFSTRPGSPGLGLTVCRMIVEQHGGTIRASNVASGGACFTMQFPLGVAA
jgi:two-component system sensor histidine kinase FlrB